MPTLLIVDDDPIVLEVLRGLLEERGRRIHTAPAAAAALELARANEIAVALVDKNLGSDDGLALARRLKEVQPEMEIVLITGYASIESAIEAVQIGAFDYLTKPVTDFSSLGLKVQSAIEKSALRRSQRALLERLTESEVRYRRVIDAAPEAIVLYEAGTGRIVEANEAALSLYGYELPDLLQREVAELRGEEADASLGPHPVLQQHRRKDGSSFAAEVTFTDFTQQGRTLKVQSARDVSARLRDEAEHRDLQDRLRAGQKLEAMGRLAGGLAHDFSNVCAQVQAHIDFLEPQLTSAEAKSDLSGIRGAIQRAATIIRQLRMFSPQAPREDEVIDLCDLASQVREALSRLIPEDVEVRFTAPATPLPVLGSLEHLRQALLNLVINAGDAMPRGGTLSLELEEEHLQAPRPVRGGSLRPGRYAHLRVRDNGAGMSAAVQQRLFEPFFTTKAAGRGAGLGLATTYGVISAAQGGIEVESQESRGSVFHVWLPLSGTLMARPSLSEPRLASGRGERVLLVEDEESLRALMGRALSASGYHVIEASDGEAGLRALGSSGLDLLITDVVMPRLDGPGLAQELRRTRPGLRVLFMTGWGETEERPLTGARALIKPFATSVLLAEVRRALDSGG